MSDEHVSLFAGESNGQRTYEPVHVVVVRDGVRRVLFTPGMVYGIAAGDEIELTEGGEFKVLRRGQNLAVRVFSEEPIAQYLPRLQAEVQPLGGRIDGQVKHGAAFTIPVSAGFKSVEAIFVSFVNDHPSCIWEYGNVYDEQSKPLGWWAAEV
jgi:hypothetical protein